MLHKHISDESNRPNTSNSPFTFGDHFITQTGLIADPKMVDRYVESQIRYKVNRLARKFCLNREDQQDLAQDFYLALIKSIDSYQPGRSTWKTYLSTVLDHRYCHQVRHLMSVETHAAMKPISLDDLNENNDDLCDLSGEEGYYTVTDLQMDIKIVAAKMPTRLQKVLLLLKDHSVTETAHILRVSAATISRAKKQIQKFFMDNGFEEFSRRMKRQVA